MLSVSDKYLQEISSSSRYMVHRVTINGTLLSQGSVTNISFTESISDNNGISVGTANSASLSLTIRDAEPMDYNGLLVKPESGLTLPDGTIEWIPLGEFWVTNFDTSNDFRTLKLTCADGMYNLTGEYESELEYPTTIEAVVNELVAKSGVKFIAPSSYPDVIVRRKPPKMSFRNAFGHAAGCCGKNARFNRNGKLEFVWYNDTGMSIERKMQYLDGMTKLGNKTLVVNFKVKGEVEKYTVNVITDNNGYVASTPSSNVLEGDTVTLSVGANNGYELATLTAKIANGNEVTLTKNGEGGYTFVQPDSDVTVTASFRQNTNGPFAISTTTGGNGTIATSKTAAKAGETVTTTINPTVYSLRSNMIGTENVEVEYSNPFIYEKAVDAVQSVMQSMAYTPVKLKYRGNPAFQAGDIVTVPDGDGIYHKVLIMSQTMTFGGGMNCTLTCPGQTAKTASFNSDSYISNEISQKLDAATSALENKIGNNNSQALTAIYKSMTSTQKVINEDINQIVDKQTTIEANVNGISTKVSETISDLENLGGRVSTAESSITQNANNIALKVSKDGVMSAIEQTPETIKIKANKVDIDNLFSQNINFSGQIVGQTETVGKSSFKMILDGANSAIKFVDPVDNSREFLTISPESGIKIGRYLSVIGLTVGGAQIGRYGLDYEGDGVSIDVNNRGNLKLWYYDNMLTLVNEVSLIDVFEDFDSAKGTIQSQIDKIGGGTTITVDDALSPTSTNPVQNKVVKEALDAKLDKKLIMNYTENEIQALWDEVFNS